jgi:predicted molibdopterin-dependent oxidoreductase YjgC
MVRSSGRSPVNRGKLCIKGWNIHEFVQSPERLTQPLLRKKEALDYTASRLKEIKEADGNDSIAFLASAKATNEENYLIQKFARAAVGTNNVDHCARL